MNRKTLVLPTVVGLLAPVLAACGGVDGGSSSSDAIVVGTTDTFTASKEAPAPIDPAYAYDVGTWNILRQTVQTLMVQPRGDGEPVPEAAEKCGFTDSGNERYACTLRKDLKFSDGEAVTAADVKFSIDRALRIKADSGVFALLSTIDTVETQGDREVIFHLKTSDATFPFKLSTPVAGIVNPDDYDKDKLRDGFDVDGSGPYTLDAEVKNDELVKAVFTKNPYYKGQLTPKNDKVEMRSFADAAAMGTALSKGDIDLMTRTMSPEQIRKLDDGSNGDIDLVRDARSRNPLPRLQHRRAHGEDESGPSGDGPDHQPRRTRLQGVRRRGPAALLAGPGHHHRPLELLLQQVRRARTTSRPKP